VRTGLEPDRGSPSRLARIPVPNTVFVRLRLQPLTAAMTTSSDAAELDELRKQVKEMELASARDKEDAKQAIQAAREEARSETEARMAAQMEELQRKAAEDLRETQQEAVRKAGEVMKKAGEAVAREERLRSFVGATDSAMPNFASGSNSRSKAPKLKWVYPSAPDKVFAGFVNQPAVARIVADVLPLVKRTEVGTGSENVAVHNFLKDVFSVIETTARRHGGTTNKPFHEMEATDDSGNRPDFVFTAPHEQVQCTNNVMFYFEAKALETVRTSGKKAKTTDMLLREGMVQVIGRMVRQYERTTERGFGCVSNGADIVFVRIEWSVTLDGVFPCYAVHFPELRTQDALRCLVGWMCEPNPVSFGLPPTSRYESEDFKFVKHLGSGGFADVVQLQHVGTGEEYAAKFVRQSVHQPLLKTEQQCLDALNAAGVAGVPTVHGFAGEGLLLQPVGVPYVAYMSSCQDTRRQALAAVMFSSLRATLQAAHAAGVKHGDVRPSNIVLDCSTEPPTPTLIDWGLGTTASAPALEEVFGVPAFMSNRLVQAWMDDKGTPLLEEDDRTALLLTYIATWFNGGCLAPWPHGTLFTASLTSDRSKWLDANVVPAMKSFPVDMQDGLATLCTQCAAAPSATSP